MGGTATRKLSMLLITQELRLVFAAVEIALEVPAPLNRSRDAAATCKDTTMSAILLHANDLQSEMVVEQTNVCIYRVAVSFSPIVGQGKERFL